MSITTITPSELQSILSSGRSADLIDVRSGREYESVHAVAARLIPLDELDARKVLEARNGRADEPIYLICAKGGRGAKACEKFIAAGFSNVINVAGGTDAWVAAGLPVVRGQAMISIQRQTFIAIGTMVLTGVILGFAVHPVFFGLCALAGCGLLMAGILDICPLAMLIAKMPWNNAKCCATGACAVSPSH